MLLRGRDVQALQGNHGLAHQKSADEAEPDAIQDAAREEEPDAQQDEEVGDGLAGIEATRVACRMLPVIFQVRERNWKYATMYITPNAMA